MNLLRARETACSDFSIRPSAGRCALGDVRLHRRPQQWPIDLPSLGNDLRAEGTVILTTSRAESDIVTSYQLQANCYLGKPVGLDEFEDLVKSINDFWLTKVKLPQQIPAG